MAASSLEWDVFVVDVCRGGFLAHARLSRHALRLFGHAIAWRLLGSLLVARLRLALLAVSALLAITPEKLAESDISTLSLDLPIGEADGQTLVDILPDNSLPSADNNLEVESLRNELQIAMAVLNGRERRVLELSFGLGCPAMTLEEIGENLDLTRERVRQLKVKAINKLSSPNVRSRLAQYL